MRNPFIRNTMAGFGELCSVLEISSLARNFFSRKYSSFPSRPLKGESGYLGQVTSSSRLQC